MPVGVMAHHKGLLGIILLWWVKDIMVKRSGDSTAKKLTADVLPVTNQC